MTGRQNYNLLYMVQNILHGALSYDQQIYEQVKTGGKLIMEKIGVAIADDNERIIHMLGNMINNGSKKMICLVRDRKIPFAGLPMEVKKVDVIGCKQSAQIKNKKIRKNFAPNSK